MVKQHTSLVWWDSIHHQHGGTQQTWSWPFGLQVAEKVPLMQSALIREQKMKQVCVCVRERVSECVREWVCVCVSVVDCVLTFGYECACVWLIKCERDWVCACAPHWSNSGKKNFHMMKSEVRSPSQFRGLGQIWLFQIDRPATRWSVYLQGLQGGLKRFQEQWICGWTFEICQAVEFQI